MCGSHYTIARLPIGVVRGMLVHMSSSNATSPDELLLPLVVSRDDARIEDDTIVRELAGPVVVVYQQRKKLLSKDDDLGEITLGDLHDEAAANFERATGEVETRPMGGCVVPTLDGKIETSLLLNPRFCDQVNEQLGGGELLAIAACRGGLVLCTTHSGGEQNLYAIASILLEEMGEEIAPGVILRRVSRDEWRAEV